MPQTGDATGGTLAWGLLGTGSIAHLFARGVARGATGTLARVGSRAPETGRAFVEKMRADPDADVSAGAAALDYAGSYDDLLADPAVDAVYVATPHTSHAEWTVKALRAGKHVLVEKPAALNHADAMTMVQAARDERRFLMEAFMYRLMPQTQKLVELIRLGEIGAVRMIEASFGFQAPFDAASRLFANDLGGGGIMDVGLYPVSFARLVAGTAREAAFADPVEVTGAGRLGATGVDEWAAGLLHFDDGIAAQVSTAVSAWLPNTANVFGETGSLHITGPWHGPGFEGGTTAIELRRFGHPPEHVEVEQDRWLYEIEADHVADCIARGRMESPVVPLADTLGNLKALDRWRAAIGLEYESEKPARAWPAPGGPAPRKTGTMAMRTVPGLSMPVSSLVMGCDNQTVMPHATAMFDDYFAQGGNCFDTAHLYGGGVMEKLLGRWIESRGVRDDIAVIAKGAHTPDCRPEMVRPQLEESLERLRTGRAEIYFLHRDDPSVPIGEWVDVLNELKDEGRIGVFGGSNWSEARMAEANAYAARTGKQGFSVLSNNFSLARMNQPIWPGVMACSDGPYRQWLEETGTAVFAWSSQARGFFTGSAAVPGAHPDPDVVRAFFSEENFERRRRCYRLAETKRVEPVTVALAYVLAQPFPVCALIGPRSIAEFRSSLAVFGVELTEDEVAWLDMRG